MNSFAEIDLVAYHLHLLSPQQELAVRTAISLDPRLAAQSSAIAATLHQFDRQEYPTMIGTATLDNHWQRLRPSLAPHRPRSPFAAWLLPISLAVAVTALLVISFWFASWSTSSSSAPQQAVAPQTSSPAPGGPSSSPLHAAAPAQPSHQRDSQPTPQPFSHFTLPAVDRGLVPPPEAATLSIPYVPNIEILQLPSTSAAILPSSSSSSVPTPTPNPAPATTPPPVHRPHLQTDISVGVFGNLIASRARNYTLPGPNTYFEAQSASPSAGVVASFHQQFRPLFGYRVASSYARNTFNYYNAEVNPPVTVITSSSINGSTYELTAAYTVQGPTGKRISTDAEVGAGALLLEPSTHTTPSGQPSRNHRRVVLGGVGFNFKLTPRLDLRAEYRVLVYKNPGFGLMPNTRYTAASEPTVSLTYHFGKTGDK